MSQFSPDSASRVLGLGCMRLSTAPDRDEERGVDLVRAALDSGVTLLDTADAYCWDESEAGHNERLIARALAGWGGDRARVTVATKGGFRRPGGRWIADGRARHLRAACEASLRALGVERIDLYQLHAPDPRTPLEASVRALAALERDGLVRAVGLSNVSVGQIEEASRVTGIASVQVELSLWREDNLHNGVAEHCTAHGIRLIAHRPLGGPERRRAALADPALAAVAERHGATPFEVALAWLLDLSPVIVPIPGPTRIEHVASLERTRRIAFTDEDRRLLDERFPAGRLMRASRASRRPSDTAAGEVVLVMGLPGAGKSTVAEELVGRGYCRLNRDETGGPLARLLPALEDSLASGSKRVVLDNTYHSRKSRSPVIETAWARGVPVRCIWADTPVEEAQVNAVWRMVLRYGRLLGPDEMRKEARRDPSVFAPGVQFRYRRELEPPQPSEGFSRIDVVRFERRRDPAFTRRAVVLWLDGVLSRSRSGKRVPSAPDDVEVLPGRREVLSCYDAEGWLLLALSWQPEIAGGAATSEEVESCFARTQALLALPLEVLHCPHPAGPPVCWCRKPLPGLGVLFMQRHRLDPAQCLYVGEGTQDAAFARRLGFQHREAAEFFGE